MMRKEIYVYRLKVRKRLNLFQTISIMLKSSKVKFPSFMLLEIKLVIVKLIL